MLRAGIYDQDPQWGTLSRSNIYLDTVLQSTVTEILRFWLIVGFWLIAKKQRNTSISY